MEQTADQKVYGVSKLHISGPLKGMETAEKTNVRFIVDRVYKSCASPAKYVVLSCVLL